MLAGDIVLGVLMVILGVVRDSSRLGSGFGSPTERQFLLPVPPWLIFVAHVVGGILLVFRRRYPSTIAISLALLAVIVPVPSAIAMTYSVARYGGRLTVVSALAGGLVFGSLLGGNLLGLLGTFDWSRGDPYSIILIAALLTAVGLYFRTRTDLQALVDEQVSCAARERDVAAEIRRLRERAELAVDLHDAVARWLTLMTLSASILDSVEDQQVRCSAAEISRYGVRALQELHAMIIALTDSDMGRSSENDCEDGGAKLADRLNALTEPGSFAPVTVCVSGAEHVDVRIAELAEAIAAEALLNARKYAIGVAVEIEAHVDAGGLNVRIGNASSHLVDRKLAGAGLGLRSLGDRCAAVGGWLVAGPRPDGGFQVNATLPLGLQSGDDRPDDTVIATGIGRGMAAGIIRGGSGSTWDEA